MNIVKSTISAMVATALVIIAHPFSASAEVETNLLTSASIKNSEGLMGAVGKPYADDWIYLPGAPESVARGETVNCSGIEAQYAAYTLLCDPSTTTNVRGQLTQYDQYVGFAGALEEDPNTVSFIVVDLGGVSTFSSLEVYQMHGSDGQVTHAEMFVSPTLTDTWPVQSETTWRSVAGGVGTTAGVVRLGEAQSETSSRINNAVTTFDFPETSGRYVMFYFQNDWRHVVDDDDDDYIEVAGAKLFGKRLPVQAAPAPAPAPTPLVQAQVAQIPKVLGSPKVSGILKVNKQTWTGNPAPTLTYKWYACSKQIEVVGKKSPKACKAIKGANKHKFRLTENQAGKFVSVLVTGTSEGTSSTKIFTRSTARVS
jgi:hypothetical protein